MKSRIFLKLLGRFVLVLLVAMVTLDFTVTRAWERSLRNEIQQSLTQKTEMLAHRVVNEPKVPFQKLAQEEAQAANARATLIDSQGRVLADSNAVPGEMENHATRPEFKAALVGSTGVDVRRSHTLGIDFLYVAVPIPGGAVRLAYPLKSIAETTKKVRVTLLEASSIAFLLALLISGVVTHNISNRLARILGFADEIAKGNFSARVSDNSNDEIGRVAVALDRTGRALESSFAQLDESKRELETLLNSMQEAVIGIGRDSRVQWANQRMEKLLYSGVRRGFPLVETLRDPDLLAAAATTLETRKVSTARSGSILPGKSFNVTAAPMPGGGAVLVLYDISDIERVEKTRRDFIANVSHELRTPLTSVQGYAETLLDIVQDETAREFIEIVRKNASRMTRLTEDLLTLAKVESGEHKLNLQPLAASELLADAEQYFREHHESALKIEINNKALKLVSADRDTISQVFNNLIDNASKYAFDGGRIEIGARDVENTVEFYVRDFGPGIPSEHLLRLFERFYRVDKARSRESGGTGLGLAIAKHIVRVHGGVITAESELGHGSTFLFTLPEARGVE